MNTDECTHEWGPAELVETGMGEINSPICNHCGEVKLVHEQRAARRHHEEIAARPINRPWCFRA